MIVSVVATGLFGSVLFLAAVRKFTFLGLKLAVMLFAAAGVYFVWNPDQMTRLAQMVGGHLRHDPHPLPDGGGGHHARTPVQ